MDMGAQDAAIGTIRARLTAATSSGWKRWSEHIEDEHEFRAHAPEDLATLLAALDAAEARQAALVAAFKLIGPALVGYDGFKTVWCTPCDREIGPIPACCADCPHGEHCPLALYDALTALPAPGGVAGEEGDA